MNQLQIEKLVIARVGKEVVHGVDLEITGGQVHVLMGPNGSGKSTLALGIMGHPKTETVSGKILFDGVELTNYSTTKRAQAGLFLSMQNIPEIGGVSITNFLWSAFNATHTEPMSVIDFHKKMQATLKSLGIPGEWGTRPLSEGFSGGEKKRLEVLQMKILQPKVAILDETDAGLDIDAMKVVAGAVLDEVARGMGALVITHYPAFLDLLRPQKVSVMMNGAIVASGGAEVGEKIKAEGYMSF